MSKAVLAVLHVDALEIAGSSQLCVGQRGGCEACSALRHIFQSSSTEAILLVDANNSLNHQVALHNIYTPPVFLDCQVFD